MIYSECAGPVFLLENPGFGGSRSNPTNKTGGDKQPLEKTGCK